MTVGQHTFKWEYTKDSSVNSNDDCGYVDDILFPISHVYTFINPASNLEAAVDGHNVALTWDGTSDAASYIVQRDGETIATVTTTEYTDVVATGGTYRYSVTVVDAQGAMSAPTSIMVTVTFAGLNENEVSFGIYPNPAENVLNVRTNALSFEYQMINSIGQVVKSGVANGNATLNVSELNNGVYFLKVVANGNTKVEKVIIK